MNETLIHNLKLVREVTDGLSMSLMNNLDAEQLNALEDDLLGAAKLYGEQRFDELRRGLKLRFEKDITLILLAGFMIVGGLSLLTQVRKKLEENRN